MTDKEQAQKRRKSRWKTAAANPTEITQVGGSDITVEDGTLPGADTICIRRGRTYCHFGSERYE